MRSQSLSVSTIVIIVIAVVVLAAVLLFFFVGFGRSQSNVGSQVDTAKCNTIVSQIAGNAKTKNDVVSTAKNLKYCSSGCGQVLQPTFDVDTGTCTLTCGKNGPSCS